MRKLLHLSIANLKNKKSMAAALIFLIMLTTLFLNLGMALAVSMSDSFYACTKRLKSPDFLLVVPTNKYDTAFEEYIKKSSLVDFVEKEEIIYIENTKNSINTLETGAIIFNSSSKRNIEPLSLLESDPNIPKDQAIYLPVIMKVDGISLGDSFSLTFQNTVYDYQIAGFFETSYMGTNTDGLLKYFMPEESFQRLYESAGTGKALSARLKEGVSPEYNSDLFKNQFLNDTDYYAKVGGLLVNATCRSYADLKDTIISLMGVPLGVMVSVALIIGIITMITTYFKVREEIDESMPAIGCLQSMGYTTGQIMFSKVAEFFLLGLIGSILGAIFGCLVQPLIRQFGIGMVGLDIKIVLAAPYYLAVLILVILLLCGSTIPAVWKIKKITPVTALRKGVRTHHFSWNPFPLKDGRMPFFLLLSLKNMCSGMRQNMVTALIIALGTFSIGVSIVLYANFGYDTTGLAKMTGVEVADVQLTPLSYAEVPALLQELADMKEVRKVSQSENYMAKINDIHISFTVCDDFEKAETLTLIRGSYPKYDNEVVLSPLLLKNLNKKIGDSVDITSRGITKAYLITGASLGTNNGSKMGMLNLSGIRRMDPGYRLVNIDLYLKDPAMLDSFMEQLYEKYGVTNGRDKANTTDALNAPYESVSKRANEQIKKMLDQYGMESVEYSVMLNGAIILSGNSNSYKLRTIRSLTDYLNGQLAAYAVMMKGLIVLILFVMFLIMGTIITITIHTMIRKQKEEFGIYKALGYTTKDLVRIISLHFTVNALIGAVIGNIACVLFASPLLKLLFNMIGLDLGAFHIEPVWLFLIGIGVILFTLVLSVQRAYQVRKITVYELLTE